MAYKTAVPKLEQSSISAAPLSPYSLIVNAIETALRNINNQLCSISKGERGLNHWHMFMPRSQPVILRRSDFAKIKELPKNPDEQLSLLLGMNQGFRHGEIRKARHEHFNVEEGVVYVADSKDHCLYPLPMDLEVASLFEKLEPSENGYILQRRNKWSKIASQPIGKKKFWSMIKQWACKANVLNYQSFTPTFLRAFFAKEWVRMRYLAHEDPNIPLLSKMLRHRDVVYTWIYLTKFVYIEDLQVEMRRFQLGVQPQKVVENLE